MANKMSDSKIAKIYADALFQSGLELYLKDKDPEAFYQLIFNIEDIIKLLDMNLLFQTYLDSPTVPKAKKKSLIQKTLGDKLLLKTINFLLILIDAKRINLLESIGVYYLDQVYYYMGIRFVDVYSTVELTTKQQTVLSTKLQSMFKPVFTKPYIQPVKIVLRVNTDSSLLGGLIIKSESKIIDLSLKGDLQRLATKLGVTI
jgi:F-type H+-transporting ATPase subunit delta